MTRNKSKRTALIKYALAAPIFLILTAALASPKLPILAKTEVLSEKVVKSIDKLETENINSLLGQINGNQIIGLTKNDSLPSNISNMKEGEMRPYLDNLREGGTMSESEIHNIKELKAYQIVNGKAVECEVTSFVMVWIPRGKDPYQANCYSKTNDEVKRLLGMAKAGEQIQFLQIKARPNGSQNSRDIGSMSMLITENINKSGEKLFKPLSELKLVDEKQIAQMNVDTKEEFNTQITITFKDGHIERYKGTKAEMEKVFKTENDAAAQKTNDQKLAEMVVVGRSTNKNLSEQKIQNVEEVPKGGQQKDKNLTEKTLTDPVFTIVEQNPEFVGGQALLFKWLGENIRYPKSARDAGAQGTVYVGFFVEKDGSITNVNIKRDVPVIIRDTITISEVNGIKGNKIVERTEYTLGKEAVRVISAMPNWKPGKSNGSPVRVAYTLPIKFKLD